MDNVINKYNLIVGGIVAALTYIFGENWTLFGIFLLFNIIDWITGWLKSRILKGEGEEMRALHLLWIIPSCIILETLAILKITKRE